MLRRVAAVALGVLLLVGLAPAMAHTTIWLCGLSEEMTRLSCVADQDEALSDLPVDSRRQTANADLVHQVRGTRFPLDPTRAWSVPLWTVPYDISSLRTLAHATICYRSPSCEVVMLQPLGHRPLLQPGRLALQRPGR